LQQQLGVFFDDMYVFLCIFVLYCIGKYGGESDDGVQWSAYFVAHVGEKSRFQAVGFFCFLFGCQQFGDVQCRTDNPPLFSFVVGHQRFVKRQNILSAFGIDKVFDVGLGNFRLFNFFVCLLNEIILH
jgi:hypothetical protein